MKRNVRLVGGGEIFLRAEDEETVGEEGGESGEDGDEETVGEEGGESGEDGDEETVGEEGGESGEDGDEDD